MIRCSILPIQDPGCCCNYPASASREQHFPTLDMLAYEFNEARREVEGRRATDEQVVQWWAVVAGRCRVDAHPAGKCYRRHGLIDMMEFDINTAVSYAGRAAHLLQDVQVGSRASVENIERTDTVQRLVGDHEEAELDGSHFVWSFGRSFKWDIC